MGMRARISDDDLISIGVYHEIRIMRNHYDLAVRLGFDKEVDQFVEHRLGIEILLRLVDHQWSVVIVVQRKIEEQKNDAARAGRQLADVDTVILDAIADRDVIGAEKP